jgi:hypothetical protein
MPAPAARESGWQRRTTVMARLSTSFVNDTLWPEFLELQDALAAYFDALTDRVIKQALDVKAGEAEERGDEANTPTPAPPTGARCAPELTAVRRQRTEAQPQK